MFKPPAAQRMTQRLPCAPGSSGFHEDKGGGAEQSIFQLSFGRGPIGLGAVCFERSECRDTQLIVQLQRLVGPQPRYGQKVQNARRNFLAHGLEAGMGTARMEFGNDIGDGIPNAGNIAESILTDKFL